MSATGGLDLSGLDRFRASDLLSDAGMTSGAGTPLRISLDLIEFDAVQPRRSFNESTLAELAASLAAHGVLEPVSLRSHPDRPGRYIVNRGERRVRAARQAGLFEVPAFLDERVDPYAQAVENLHRESMSPFDLALFIQEREAEGHTRAEIARRLNKSRSFVTEAACLIDAPIELRNAFDAGRLGADARILYRLAVALHKQPERAKALLSGVGPLTRASVDVELSKVGENVKPDGLLTVGSPAAPAVGRSGGRTVLVVDHRGRRGALRLKARDDDCAEVVYGDGSQAVVLLNELRLVCWAAEES